ncbi:pentapeptide repeat-containing protein [Salinisphaera dokdonensis CL-ES53]|uniref:Pentapeptide repeat-containing protein n=2 Tax=Salinisphaera TaxID=180541 RepID=A0ABV2AYI5_9GAMM
MDNMSLVKADFSNTVIDGVFVYGTSTWDLKLDGATQQNIYISSENLTITVPDLELAQFIALLIRNSNIRKIIDTITSKVVLILGRFTPERKAILDEIKVEIQAHGFLPVLFDFEGPESRDLTETIMTLASMSRFVVADISGAKSVPQELAAIVPHLPSLPVQPIIQDGERGYGMFEHFERYPWVLERLVYTSGDVGALVESVVNNCERRRASGA